MKHSNFFKEVNLFLKSLDSIEINFFFLILLQYKKAVSYILVLVIERELASKVYQRVLRWFGHVERMDEYHMARRVLMTDVSGGRVRGRPRLGWMDGVKVALGNRGMMVVTRHDYPTFVEGESHGILYCYQYI